jgi:hypothetical protein
MDKILNKKPFDQGNIIYFNLNDQLRDCGSLITQFRFRNTKNIIIP